MLGLKLKQLLGALPKPTMKDPDFLKLVREAFAIEGDELVQSMTTGLLELKQGPAPERRIEVAGTICRDAHSLKGAAGVVGAATRGEIVSVCEGLEGIFLQWKISAVTAPPETFDLLNRAVELLGNLVQQAATSIDPADRMKVTRIIPELAAISPAAIAAPPPRVDE